MADFIEREKILRKLRGECLAHYPSYCIMGILPAANEVANIPAADVRPVVRGKWIDGNCNQCGEHSPFWSMATTYYESPYCPYCGAYMREENE